MADEVRETIRAAQAAELRGDIPGAIAMLQRAAALYCSAGNRARAMQMLRQALRLDDARADVAEELRRLEQLPEGAPLEEAASERAARERRRQEQELLSVQTLEALALAAGDETLDAAALERALESAAALLPDGADAARLEQVLESAEGLLPELGAPPRAAGRGAGMVERGPTRADPSREAWCSFCCRPAAEVGALIAGPAGAFICVGCARESTALLGAVPVPHAAPRAPAATPLPLVGQEAAQELLARALARGTRPILVLGPEGSGKSTWVRALVAEGRAVLGDPSQPQVPAPGTVLVLEDVHRLGIPAQEALAAWLEAQPSLGVLLTARGEPTAPALTLEEGGLRLAVHTDEALAEATSGALGARLLRGVGPVLWLARPDAALLEQVARARLRLQEGVELPQAALRALALQALDAGGAGHALESLLGRLVTGSWRLPAQARAAPPPRTRRGKRKA